MLFRPTCMSVGTKTVKLAARRCKDKKNEAVHKCQSWRPGHWHIIQGGLRIDAHMYNTENALSSSTKILNMNSAHVYIRDFQLCTNFLAIMLSEPNIYEYYLHLFMTEIISVNICKSQIEAWPYLLWGVLLMLKVRDQVHHQLCIAAVIMSRMFFNKSH